MHVDCETCVGRGRQCSGCVITMLLGAPPDGIEWDETERAAIGALADSGLVRPPLLSPTGEDGASRAPWVVGVRADRAG
jgi:hypothetical protein